MGWSWKVWALEPRFKASYARALKAGELRAGLIQPTFIGHLLRVRTWLVAMGIIVMDKLGFLLSRPSVFWGTRNYACSDGGHQAC